MVFITLEDETGIVNLNVWRDTFERYRTTMLVEGKAERQGQVVYVHASEIVRNNIHDLRTHSRDFH